MRVCFCYGKSKVPGCMGSKILLQVFNLFLVFFFFLGANDLTSLFNYVFLSFSSATQHLLVLHLNIKNSGIFGVKKREQRIDFENLIVKTESLRTSVFATMFINVHL